MRYIVQMGDIVVKKIPFKDNLTNPINKTLTGRAFDGHMDNISVKCVPSIL